MKSRTELLTIAKKQLGNGGAKYRSYVGCGGNYCDMFVFWLYDANGCGTLLPWKGKARTYCPASIKWCRANLAQLPLYWALLCDIIYFDWEPNGNPNHVGIVERRRSATSIDTIEGNTSGGIVDDKTRNGKYIQGVFRTHFLPEKAYKCKLSGDGLFGDLSVYNLQLALGMKATGIFTKETAKYLQRKVGATPDGAIGPATARKLQTFLGVTQDGEIGPATTRALQKWCNKVNYPQTDKKPAETKSAPTATKSKTQTKTKTTKKGYTGTLPTLNNNAKIINGYLHRMCWPNGTPKNKYTYKKGKPLKAYSQGIDKARPDHKNWPNKKQRVGACCDVLPCVVLDLVGIEIPKDLKNQLVQMPKMTSKLTPTTYYKVSQFKPGMIVQRGRKNRSGHTFGICEVVSYDEKNKKIIRKKYIANAHYKKLGGTYAVMDSKAVDQKPSKWKYYKCYIVNGAIRNWYGLHDYGIDVLYIQMFLKWAGYYNGKLDAGYGDYTQKCVARFQKAVGLKGDGCVGELTIKKMKAYKK